MSALDRPTFDNYPNNWFGFLVLRSSPVVATSLDWGEAPLPWFEDFVDESIDAERRRLAIAYLDGAPCGVGTFSYCRCPHCGEEVNNATYCWDGVWFWPISVIHDIEKHQIWIPRRFERHLADREFIPPSQSEVQQPEEFSFPSYAPPCFLP